VVLDVIQDGRASVICSHRPALPTIFETLKKYAPDASFDLLEEGPLLKPAEMMVMHLTAAEGRKKRKIVSVERYGVI
jgi:8-oxo-dGTP diphosphatase